jgi:hypothetical protein
MGTGLQLSPEQSDTLTHAHQSVAPHRSVALFMVVDDAAPVVEDVDFKPGLDEAQADVSAGCSGMLEGVGESFLHDPVGGEIDPNRQAPGLALDPQLDCEAHPPN